MSNQTPLQKIEIALTTLAIQREEDSKELKGIHGDVQRLLDPETGVYPKIEKVKEELVTQITAVREEVHIARTRTSMVSGALGAVFGGMITFFGQYLIKKHT